MAIRRRSSGHGGPDRVRTITVIGLAVAGIIVARFFTLQVFQHGFYQALAEGQHGIFQELFPERGDILARERDGGLFPLATTRQLTLVYANPSKVEHAAEAAKALDPLLDLDEATILERLSKPNDLYEPLQHEVPDELNDQIAALTIPGIAFAPEATRYYPDGAYDGQLIGFLGFDGDERRGQYGIEGTYDEALAGEQGHLAAERDAGGRLIPIGQHSFVPARDGDDLVLTIDRAIQYRACSALSAAVLRHGADGGSLVILNPKTGAVLAMCGAPNFDPNDYRSVEDLRAYTNPTISGSYESGSVMKPFTLAAALDQGKVTPTTTYTDEGSRTFGSFTIRNSDGKAHGLKSMTQVLEESLNTGAIFAMEQVGAEAFRRSLHSFGFGAVTAAGLDGEQAGDLSSLDQKSDIFPATASFGQGITVTPLQLAAAYGAIANRGVLMQPYLIDEVIKPDGTRVTTEPQVVRQVIQAKTATTLAAMLVNVVQNGHGGRAAVPGYYIAGKTGTAQVPKADGPGYDSEKHIGTFAGFGPVEDPRFVMVVRIDVPRDVQFAESSAAPLFGDIANFLLHYLDVPPSVPTE